MARSLTKSVLVFIASVVLMAGPSLGVCFAAPNLIAAGEGSVFSQSYTSDYAAQRNIRRHRSHLTHHKDSATKSIEIAIRRGDNTPPQINAVSGDIPALQQAERELVDRDHFQFLLPENMPALYNFSSLHWGARLAPGTLHSLSILFRV